MDKYGSLANSPWEICLLFCARVSDSPVYGKKRVFQMKDLDSDKFYSVGRCSFIYFLIYFC